MANEAVLPVTKPCCKAWQKISISRIRPTNSFGLTRKLGSGSMSPLQSHERHNRQFTLVIFVTFVEQTQGRQACRLSAQRWEERVGGFTVVGESVSGQIDVLELRAWSSNGAQ